MSGLALHPITEAGRTTCDSQCCTTCHFAQLSTKSFRLDYARQHTPAMRALHCPLDLTMGLVTKARTFTSSCMWRSSCACAGLASSLAPICSSALHLCIVSCVRAD